MGRKKLRFPSKTDCHPQKGFVNWWEDIVCLSKKRARQMAKRKIKRELDERL
jgi:3-hydroxy-3-methylglutaryl CoA synthase